MEDLRNGWDNIDELVGIPGYGIKSLEKFIKGRSISIYQKVRNIYIRNFIIKSVAALFIVSNLFLYRDYRDIMILHSVMLILLAFLTVAEIRYYNIFRKSTDPGNPSKENLTSLLLFLKRKFPLSALLSATTFMFGFVPGILLYLILAHGQHEPFAPMSYFVYSFLCVLGILTVFILDIRQVSYHSKHIRICLSDLNDNALALASENIESKRKLDSTIIVLIQAIILLAFLVMIVLLKSVFT